MKELTIEQEAARYREIAELTKDGKTYIWKGEEIVNRTEQPMPEVGDIISFWYKDDPKTINYGKLTRKVKDSNIFIIINGDTEGSISFQDPDMQWQPVQPKYLYKDFESALNEFKSLNPGAALDVEDFEIGYVMSRKLEE